MGNGSEQIEPQTHMGAPVIGELKFTGGRFDRPGVPADRLGEIENFQKLFEAVAQTVWLKAHPDKKQIPSTLKDEVALSFFFKEGSVDTMMVSTPRSHVQEDFLGGIIPESGERLSYLFNEIVNNDNLPPDIEAREVRPLLNIGARFADGEAVTIESLTGEHITYDTESRERFEAMLDELDISYRTVGRVVMLNSSLKFELKPLDGTRKIEGSFENPALFETLRSALATQGAADPIWVDCIASLHPISRDVIRITDVNKVRILDHTPHDTEKELAFLASLNDGWCEGEGKQTSFETVAIVSALLSASSDAGITKPVVAGDPDGGAFLQWNQNSVGLMITVDEDQSLTAHFVNTADGSDETQKPNTVDEAIDFVRGKLDAHK